MKTLARRLAQLSTALLLALSLAPAQGCAALEDECDEGEYRCENNVAMRCGVKSSDAHKAGNPYVWHRTPCGDLVCQAGSAYAFCALSSTPDPACSGSTSVASERCPSSTSWVSCIDGFAVERRTCLSCAPAPSPQDTCQGGLYSHCSAQSPCVAGLGCSMRTLPDGSVEGTCLP